MKLILIIIAFLCFASVGYGYDTLDNMESYKIRAEVDGRVIEWDSESGAVYYIDENGDAYTHLQGPTFGIVNILRITGLEHQIAELKAEIKELRELVIKVKSE